MLFRSAALSNASPANAATANAATANAAPANAALSNAAAANAVRADNRPYACYTDENRDKPAERKLDFHKVLTSDNDAVR